MHNKSSSSSHHSHHTFNQKNIKMSSGLSEADQKELQSFIDTEQAKARVQSSIHNFTDVSFRAMDSTLMKISRLT
jgi:hypothetical protein